MDLVVCRNVLIYFREEAIQRIVDRFHESLVDGGWLVVGHAEPSQEIFHRFQVSNFPGTIVYRRTREGQQGKPIVPKLPEALVKAAAPARPKREMPKEPVKAKPRQPVKAAAKSSTRRRSRRRSRPRPKSGRCARSRRPRSRAATCAAVRRRAGPPTRPSACSSRARWGRP
jgi:chemotaxis protein methyltransferase CheR